VVNVGAGAGSYEPADRYVLAVEPSAAMRARRSFTKAVPAINAVAEALPFDDASIDAAMAIFTVHQSLAGQRGGYFNTELVSDTWRKSEVEVTQRFWRRPLAATVNAFGEAGFAVDGIIETRPDPQAVNRWPDELGSLTDIPTFIIYRLRLL